MSPTSEVQSFVKSQNVTAKLTTDSLDQLHKVLGEIYVELGMRFKWTGIDQNDLPRHERFPIQHVIFFIHLSLSL